jgi:type II secretory pathway component PulF
VSASQLALFYRQFSAMLAAGMTITNALATISHESNSTIRILTKHINKHVMAGGRLSEGMAMFPHIFTLMQREMIAASEDTGGLDAVMVRLSEYLEAEAALKRMIKRETFMPKVNFAATFLLPTLVVAVMQGMNAYFHQAVMPLLEVLGIFAIIWGVGRYALKANAIAVTYDTVKAYLPYFGTTVRMLGIAKFSRALASLYGSGVLIPTAVDIAARTTGNAFLTWQMRKTVPAMMAGAGLTESFRHAGIFPPMFLSMLGTGEHTGNLDQTLTKMAEFYEAESAVRLHQSVQALNVLIFLLVATIVGYEVIHFWMNYYGGIMGSANDN